MNLSLLNGNRITWLAVAVVTSITGLILLLISRYDPSLLFLSGILIGVSLSVTIRLLFNSYSKKRHNSSPENDVSP